MSKGHISYYMQRNQTQECSASVDAQKALLFDEASLKVHPNCFKKTQYNFTKLMEILVRAK